MIDRTALVLLSARRMKDQAASLPRRGLPFVAGIALLFVSGFCERYLRNDPSGHALRLYLFGVSCAASGLAAAAFSGTTRDILLRTAVFPVTPWAKFIFAGLGTLFNPVSTAFLLAGMLSVWILYGDGLLLRALSAVNFAALVLCAQLCTLLALLLPIGRRKTAIIAGSVLLAAFFLSGVVSLFSERPGWLPGPGWAGEGMLAAVRGDAGGALLYASFHAAILAVLAAAGRRIT